MMAAQLAQALETDGPGSGPEIYSDTVRRISDVHCENSDNDGKNTANCTYIAAYHGSLVREVVTLSPERGEWFIVGALSVTLRRSVH
jgi:hypothetical protein